MLILDTVIVTVDENVLFAVRNRTHHSNIKSAKMKHCVLWRWAILSPTEIQIIWISAQKCPQYLPDGRWHYVLNFASYIFVRTKILLIVFVPCLDFRISLSLVDGNCTPASNVSSQHMNRPELNTCIPAGPILSVFPALIAHCELKSVHPGFPVAFIF